MATPAAAISTSNAKAIAVSSFFEGMIQPDDSWSKIVDFRTDDVAALNISALTGVPTPGSWDGTSDLTGSQVVATGSTGKNSHTYTVYAQACDVNRYDILDVPNILQQFSRKQGLSVASLYAEQVWSTLGGAFATATTADGAYLCSAAHLTTGANRSNLGSSALDRSSFLAGIQALREHVNYQGQVYDLAQYKKYLVVPAELEEVALQIVGSSVSSSEMQINTAGLYNTEVIVAPYLTDANDWFLIVDPSVEAPLTFWQRQAPRYQVIQDQDNLKMRLIFDGAISCAASAQPDGIYGAGVT